MVQTTHMPTGRPVWIWDVSQSVGWVKPDDRSDVGLVQLLINRIVRVKDLRDSRGKYYQGPDDPMFGRVHGYPLLDFLEVDGWFGPETANAINAYQAATPYFRDGVVDPVYPLIAADALYLNRTIYQLNLDGLMAYGTMLSEDKFPPWMTYTST
jgi:hypothetical protein